MFNNLMVIPNSLALFALSSVVVGHTDEARRLVDEADEENQYIIQAEN